jgi:hypothetical protein
MVPQSTVTHARIGESPHNFAVAGVEKFNHNDRTADLECGVHGSNYAQGLQHLRAGQFELRRQVIVRVVVLHQYDIGPDHGEE